MAHDIITRQDDTDITTLTLNHPQKLNALSDEMLQALSENFHALAQSTTKVVILKAKGKAFCAGHDLSQMQAMRQNSDAGQTAFTDLFARCASLMTQIRTLPQPVIAQVHGLATAAGCQLVASCDLATASDTAQFGVNGVNIGLFCSTPMVALSRNIPRKKAFELLTTGRFMTAQEAETFGLVNQVTAPDALDKTTLEMAQTIASKLSLAVKIGKGAFYEQLEMSTKDAYAYTQDVMVENLMANQTEEGMAAFLEKRRPNWTE